MRAVLKSAFVGLVVLVLAGCTQAAMDPPTAAAPSASAEGCLNEVAIDGANYELVGNVRDEGVSSTPVAGVRLEIAGSSFSFGICSGEDGRFRASVPKEGAYTLSVDPSTIPEGLVVIHPEGLDDSLSWDVEPGLVDRVVVNVFLGMEGQAEAPPALLQANFANSDGYQYSAQVLSATVTPTVDRANAKPGEVILQMRSTAEGSITNLTAERIAPAAGLVTPYWLIGSPICEIAVKVEPAMCWFPNLSIQMVAMGTGNGEMVGEIPVDGTIAIPDAAFGALAGPPLTVPEADEPALVAAASAPDGYLLYGEDLEPLAGTPACSIESSTHVVAASGALAC